MKGNGQGADSDLVSIPAVHFAQPIADLLLHVQDVQPHLLLRDFQFALQLLEQGLTTASIGWCLKRVVTSHKPHTQHRALHRAL